MRKRWAVPDGFLITLFGVWMFGGMGVVILVAALTNPCTKTGCGLHSEHLSTAFWIAFATWLGPVVLLLGSGLVYGTARSIWENRPRRVVESVHEDLREVRDA
jgi:hypothetical protein